MRKWVPICALVLAIGAWGLSRQSDTKRDAIRRALALLAAATAWTAALIGLSLIGGRA